MSKNNKKLISKILVFTMLLGMGSTLVACGASSAPMSDSPYAGAGVMDSAALNGFLDFDMSKSESIAMSPSRAPEEPKTPQSTDTNTNAENTESYLDSQKLIYTCNINIESLEFTATQAKIQELITQYGGFVESNRLYDNAYGWYYSSYEKTSGTLTQELTVRIPSEHYDAFVNGVSSVGKVQNKTESVQNITTQYNDTETTVKSLRAQEKRLLEMMEACNSIDDMITVERRLSEVQMQLERYQTQLNAYDADVKFSTINIVLKEVQEYTPVIEEQNFFQRLKEHLETTVEDFGDFIEWALFASIYLLPYGLIIAILVILIRKVVSNRKAKRSATTTVVPAATAPVEQKNNNADAEKAKDISVQAEVGSKKKDKN